MLGRPVHRHGGGAGERHGGEFSVVTVNGGNRAPRRRSRWRSTRGVAGRTQRVDHYTGFTWMAVSQTRLFIWAGARPPVRVARRPYRHEACPHESDIGGSETAVN